MKQRRRTLKNRNYASSCREKKDEEIMTLEKLKGDFWMLHGIVFQAESVFVTSSDESVVTGEEIDEVTRMEEENTRIQEEIKAMETKYQMILEFARDQNLEIVS